MADVLKSGLVGNGQAEDGQIQELIENAEPGSTIYFPATEKGYAFNHPIVIDKSLTIQGDGAATIIRSSVPLDALIKIYPTSFDEKIVVHLKDFKLIDGYRGIDISGTIHISGTLSGTSGIAPQSSIQNVEIENFKEIGVKLSQEKAEFFVKDLRVSSSLFGFWGRTFGDYNQLYFENCLFEGAEYGMYFSGAANCSGAVAFNYVSQIDNTVGFVFENITYTLQSPTYINTPIQVVNSGSTQASSLVSHASTHGSGSSDQILATSLTSQGVADGAVLVSSGDGGWTTINTSSLASAVSVDPGDFEPFSASMKSFSASVQSQTSSIQTFTASIKVFTASVQSFTASFLAHTASYLVSSASFADTRNDLDVHILDTANPHATSIGNLDPGTLSELNSIINDATLDDSSASRTPLAHSASHYSGSSDALHLQKLGGIDLAGNVVLVSNGLGGWKTLTSASMIEGHPVAPLAHASTHNSGAADALHLQNLGGTGLAADVSLVTNGAGGWKTVTTASIVSGHRAAAHSSLHLSGASDAINAQDLAGATLAADVILVSNGLGGWKTLTSASVISGHRAASHASTHNSGAADAINAQNLGGATLAADVILVSDGNGGWKTLTSASVISGHRAAAHASTHNSGAADALHLQNLGGTGVPADRVLVSDGLGGWKTVASQSVGPPGGAGVSEGTFQAFSGAIVEQTASIQAFSASMLAASASFVVGLTSQTASITRLDAASGTFRSELTSQTASITRLNAASGTFEAHRTNTSNPHATSIANIGAGTLAELNAAVSDANLDDAGDPRDPNVHSSTHNSGASDALHLQNLGGATLAADVILVSNGLGGWKTLTSASVISGHRAASHSSLHLSGAADAINVQDLGGSGIAVNRVLISNANGGWTTATSQSVGVTSHTDLSDLTTGDPHTQYSLKSVLNPFTASVQTSTASLQTVSGTLLAASASFRTELDSQTTSVTRLDAASASFVVGLTSQTASITRLNAASGTFESHRTNTSNPHATSIANIGAGTLAELNAAVSDANLDDSSATRTPSSHAASHLSGASDAIQAQSLGGSTLGADVILVSDGNGGWKTLASASVISGHRAAAHAITHNSGAADALHLQNLGGTGLAADVVLVSNGLGGWKTVASQSVGPPGGAGVSEGTFQAFSGAVVEQTASIQAFSASILAASASFVVGLTSQTASITRLNAASASFVVGLTSQTASITRLDAASGTFRTELTSQTASITRMDAASGTFRVELTSQTASITRLNAASASFETLSYPQIQTWTGTAMTMSNASHGVFYILSSSAGAGSTVFITSSLKLGTTAEFQRNGTAAGASLTLVGKQCSLEFDTATFLSTSAARKSTMVVTIIYTDSGMATASVRGDMTLV